MTLREQALIAVLTFLVIPTALKAFDWLMKEARARFGNGKRKTYAEMERENWQMRQQLRRVADSVKELEQWQSAGKLSNVEVGIAGLRSEIDPAMFK